MPKLRRGYWKWVVILSDMRSILSINNHLRNAHYILKISAPVQREQLHSRTEDPRTERHFRHKRSRRESTRLREEAIGELRAEILVRDSRRTETRRDPWKSSDHPPNVRGVRPAGTTGGSGEEEAVETYRSSMVDGRPDRPRDSEDKRERLGPRLLHSKHGRPANRSDPQEIGLRPRLLRDRDAQTNLRPLPSLVLRDQPGQHRKERSQVAARLSARPNETPAF